MNQAMKALGGLLILRMAGEGLGLGLTLFGLGAAYLLWAQVRRFRKVPLLRKEKPSVVR